VKKEFLITFEIRKKIGRIPIAFVIKEEVEEFEGIELVHKKVDLSGIPKLVQKYNIKYSNYLYYHWLQRSTFLKQPSHSNNNTSCRFPSFPSCHTLRYILTTCTSTIDITLNWATFVEFYELVVSNEKLETYALEHYLNLGLHTKNTNSYL
jgi:hypothetical protein